MPFLKPSDISHVLVEYKGYDSATAHALALDLCEAVNRKIAEAPTVYGKLQDASGYGFAFTRTRGPGDTQRARLVCIEPLKLSGLEIE